MPTYTAFHGTVYRFDKPTDFAKLKSMDFGPGFYFTIDRRDAESYGPLVYEAKVRIENPIVVSSTKGDDFFVRSFARAIGATMDDVQTGVDHGSHPVSYLFELARTLIDVGSISQNSIRKWLLKSGFDGVIVDPDIVNATMKKAGAGARMHGRYVAVFSPEQILSWNLSPKVQVNRRASGRRASRRRNSKRR